MDEFQLLGVIAVSAGIGFIAATVKHGREMRKVRQRVTVASLESVTRLMQAALTTLIEDFKVPENDAVSKLFARAEAAGMKLMRVDPKTGESSPISGDKK
jgi:hypothetical protein